MKIERVSNKEAELTCLQGYVDIDFDDLCEAFGAPDLLGESGDGKVRAQWVLRFGGEVIATIYDWKESKPLETLRDWHIGGKGELAVQCVSEALWGFAPTVSDSRGNLIYNAGRPA